jgi:hypothetical protein
MQRLSYEHQMLACRPACFWMCQKPKRAPDPSLSSAVSACSLHPPGKLMASPTRNVCCKQYPANVASSSSEKLPLSMQTFGNDQLEF